MNESEYNISKYVLHLRNGVKIYSNEEPKYSGLGEDGKLNKSLVWPTFPKGPGYLITAIGIREPAYFNQGRDGGGGGDAVVFEKPRNMYVALEDIIIFDCDNESAYLDIDSALKSLVGSKKDN